MMPRDIAQQEVGGRANMARLRIYASRAIQRDVTPTESSSRGMVPRDAAQQEVGRRANMARLRMCASRANQPGVMPAESNGAPILRSRSAGRW